MKTVLPSFDKLTWRFGETRFTTGTTYTDKLFTGQRDVGLDIYHYGAR